MSPFTTLAVVVASSIAGCCYLVVNGHPWFGAFVLLIVLGSNASSKKNNDSDKPDFK